MANPLRGEASFKAGASEFTLVYDINTFCELEDETSFSITELIDKVQGNPSFSLLRSIICAGLQARHPKTSMTEAGEIMSDAGLAVVTGALRDALKAAMPPATKAGAGEAGKGRKKAGTGLPS